MFCMTDISNIYLAQCWKLKTSSRPKISLKRQYNVIWPFLIIDIYHFLMSLSHLFKKKKNETLECWHNWLVTD